VTLPVSVELFIERYHIGLQKRASVRCPSPDR